MTKAAAFVGGMSVFTSSGGNTFACSSAVLTETENRDVKGGGWNQPEDGNVEL